MFYKWRVDLYIFLLRVIHKVEIMLFKFVDGPLEKIFNYYEMKARKLLDKRYHETMG